MSETRQLAEFVAATRFEDLPREVVEATRIYTLDNLACGLVAAHLPWTAMVAEMALEAGCQEQCTVMGRPWRTSPSYAALVNGTAIGGFETDHAYFQGSAHPGAAVFPAVLAIAERDRLDGKRFIAALAMGYELLCRIGGAATRAVEDVAGFHGPATNGPFGAAVGAGKALGLSVEQMVDALGIAGSQAGGLLEFVREGAMIKRFHLARACQTGLESALLAQKGLTGPSTVMEGPRGFLHVFSPSPQVGLLTSDLGREYRLLGITAKAYACHSTHQAYIAALADFKRRTPINVPAIERVVVSGSQRLAERHSQQEPQTLMGAQYSLAFAVAVALARDIDDPQVFSDGTLWDREVRGLARKVEMAADTSEAVLLEMGGRRYAIPAADWKGSATNPYTFDEMVQKFRTYAGRALEDAAMDSVVEMVRHLEELDDVSLLAKLLKSRQADTSR